MQISDIYVSITGSLLPQINIRLCRKNSQHSMLAHTDFNDILIENYEQEIFLTFILEDGV